ncbi:hypothetical protein [Streptomyces glaucus]|uniref:hypothetical protein n=1 Tax=Streptomyces glaucus TaxID=284029 RepID=UPI0031DC6447
MHNVPSLLPVASGAFYTEDTFWTAAGVAVALVVGCGGVWAAFRAAHPRRRLTYTVSHRPLVHRHIGGNLEVRRNGTLLTDPHLVEVVLTNPGRRDIASTAFDGGEPLRVDLAVPYLEVLRTESSPSSAQLPPARVHGSVLSVGPGRIGCGTTISYLLLVDTAPTYTCRHSLLDVEVRHLPAPQARRTTRQTSLVRP